MAITRENILSLIGSNRYRSAIITTFSFDFYFFEMKAMKWLKSCGVSNVNVLIDGHYYSELMKNISGDEMHLTPGYSLYPVFQNSIFHPKIWMLFGDKEALLIIGSGNLTNAGNGNNEEIWGAFHYDIRTTDNLELFSLAWSYIQQLCVPIKGVTKDKTNRYIFENAKWLNDLPKTKPFQFINTSGKGRVALLYNIQAGTIWQQLLALIRKEKVTEITVLSPFYDLKGVVLQELKSTFPSAILNVVIDENSSVPSELSALKGISFFDWSTMSIRQEMHSKMEGFFPQTKLHAKIIHFKTAGKREFCLFGSANCTPEGLGLSGHTANSEVSILCEVESGGILNQLGIKLKTPKKLNEFNPGNQPSIYQTIIKSNKHKIKLVSAEWIFEDLDLYVDGSYDYPVLAKLYDRENRLIKTIAISKVVPDINVKITWPIWEVQFVELFDTATDKPISNKVILADVELLMKTHPNPKNKDIESIFSDIQNGELSRVVDLLHYAILDDSETNDFNNILQNRNTNKEKENIVQPLDIYDLSTYKPQDKHGLERSLLLSSSSLRILDAIRFANNKILALNYHSELIVDEQEEDLGTSTGVEEKESAKPRNITRATLNNERYKLEHYFKNLRIHQVDTIYFKENFKNYKVSLTDLTRYLIALELMMEYGGKSEKYVEESKEYSFTYLSTSNSEPSSIDNLKGCCNTIIGTFLMLCRNGFKEYEFEYTQAKMQQLKLEALATTLVCIFNNNWIENEQSNYYTLLLNTLHYLGDKNPSTINSLIRTVIAQLDTKIASLKHQSTNLSENVERFKSRIIPTFQNSLVRLHNMDFDSKTSRGKIIYKSPWGYCFVKGVTSKNYFTLVRPGFLWDEKQDDFVCYLANEIYKPINLPFFIEVDL